MNKVVLFVHVMNTRNIMVDLNTIADLLANGFFTKKDVIQYYQHIGYSKEKAESFFQGY